MADDTTPTPAHLGRARVQPNGTVDTGGRPAWVWAEDEDTGHRFDIRSTSLPRKGVRPVPDYPLNTKRFARPAKTRHQWEEDPGEREIRAERAAAQAPATAGSPVETVVPHAEDPSTLAAPAGTDQTTAAPGGDVAGEPATTTPDAGTTAAPTSGKARR